MEIDTACVHGSVDRSHNTGAICTPIYQSATFAHPAVGQTNGYDYSRLQNPTREQLEKTVARLEGGYDALAFSTGMAAESCLIELFSPGDEIIASDDLYGGTVRLFEHIARKNGVSVNYVNTSNVEAVRQSITERTKAVFLETPSNPMMHVTDIKAIKETLVDAGAGRGSAQACAGRGQKAPPLFGGVGGGAPDPKDIILVVDNTFLSPYLCQPLSLGADIVIHSGTKYLGGHNDTLAGFLVVSEPTLSEKLRFIQKTTGANLSPFDSYMLIRGIKTLAIRMEKAQANAARIVDWMLKQDKIAAVHYVGLPNHPGIEITKRQTRGFGAMISFETDTVETARQILNRVSLILFAESLGGVETLITYPLMQTHGDVPPEKRAALGITEKLLRLSVGIENVDDLIADLDAALA
ncbi:MAG: PLP-dependent aspartate aminotransferase family protein [Oscillospiraceae bacterium]|jgi:cystathionine gamma-synthase|nr:PLP-dependent aspartate aminotransferase family protein [Oscillospiraceae bacterium]